MKILRNLLLPGLILVALYSFNKWYLPAKPRVLVFSKTTGFRHGSIEAGKAALVKMGNEQGFLVDTTENADWFTEDSLKHYAAVIFLSTTGNALNGIQQAEFERYIQAGGGYVGVHAAADTEYDWPWYGKLAGGWFLSHPKQQEAVINVVNGDNIATKHLPAAWKRFDEWYNYKDLNPDVTVLLKLDEKSYEGGKNGDNHPIAWFHAFDGGRAFYTGLGHTDASYQEPLFLAHLLGGIKYAIGGQPLNYANAKTARAPDNNRFVKTTLTQGTLYEPTEIAVLPNLDVLISQRRGELMLYKNETKQVKSAGALDVYAKTKVNTSVNAEEGLLGIAADPDFALNKFVYVFYSPADTSVNRLSRFKFVNDQLDKSSEKIILQFYSQREICCHTGGSIAFGPGKTLFVSTGDNSTPFDAPKEKFVNKGYAPMDNREGLHQYDAGRSSGNTNDLRGKILRIVVNSDGSYKIPQGNLFPEGTGKTRPEIYVMGDRNPYRIAVDQESGYLYWGEVGPDAQGDDPARGPRGYDEVNQARKAGYFGWPYFIGNNIPYNYYDYKTGESGAKFDPAKPMNISVNNTGLKDLPPAQPAFIWYPYGKSKEFPDVGDGGRTAMAGPVYHSGKYPAATRYPSYYDDKLFIYEWVRNWIKVVTMKENGDYTGMEPFMPGLPLSAPVDMELGPDGRLYVLEYGKGWFAKNADAGLSRIDYLAGNRPPEVKQVTLSQTSGLLPFTITAKAEVTDPDRDAVTYVWNLGNGIRRTTTTPTIRYTYTRAGAYPVSVQVLDPKKASAKSDVTTVYAGNAQPEVSIALSDNQTFYFPGKPVSYSVAATDKGAVVTKANIYVSNSYREGMDMAGAALGHQVVADNLAGKALMQKSDCMTCHKIDTKSIGPAFTQVSAKYKDNADAMTHLYNKILKGGGGVWGEVPMPAHASMPVADAKKIVEWVLSLNNQEAAKPSLPLAGKIVPEQQVKDRRIMVIQASYADRGASGVKPLTGNAAVYLRSNLLDAAELKTPAGLAVRDSSGNKYLVFPEKTGSFKTGAIDLSNIGSINLTGFSRGDAASYTVEVRLDKENGALIGHATWNIPAAKQAVNLRVPLQPAADKKLHDVYVAIKSAGTGVKQKPLLKTMVVEHL
ncbi:ThuA domain-containing protein [Hufsiella ginkgonis]|uniref:PKD domain-containing protein n=1 Tax=Hufsiella ginkgonis TaxID=2695274 RepID=A0A7K1XZ36_9SPHI|nr:ThuA domain-containing protein [Hufsiella ginkgonis]MXV16088.1 PKD domain-containing protein [Hufsiella ginkgonis]